MVMQLAPFIVLVCEEVTIHVRDYRYELMY